MPSTQLLESISVTAKSDYLLQVIQDLSTARTLSEITELVRHAARELVAAEGATFVLRENDLCHYVDEEAIAPLWKGKRFPLSTCVSGWAMLNRKSAVIPDIYNDPRVPVSAYQPTFVKSLVMTPIRTRDPIGAIGAYWAKPHDANDEEVTLLRILANSTSIALENILIFSELKKSNEVLSDLLKSRDEFLSVAAHELRTPLSSLKLQLQMTETDITDAVAAPNSNLTDASGVSDDLATALRQVQKLEVLVDQLLDVSRIQLDRLDLRKSAFSLDDAIHSVLEQMTPTLRDSKNTVDLKVETPSLQGDWDRVRIEQVFTNLLSNACKYAPGEKIDITVRHVGDEMQVLLRDRGPGIAASAREKVFERFVRATDAAHISGLGLGLSIVRSILVAHEGSIDLTDSDSPGAAFLIRLPFTTMTVPMSPNSESPNPNSQNGMNHG